MPNGWEYIRYRDVGLGRDLNHSHRCLDANVARLDGSPPGTRRCHVKGLSLLPLDIALLEEPVPEALVDQRLDLGPIRQQPLIILRNVPRQR